MTSHNDKLAMILLSRTPCEMKTNSEHTKLNITKRGLVKCTLEMSATFYWPAIMGSCHLNRHAFLVSLNML